jgi:plastocyanin
MRCGSPSLWIGLCLLSRIAFADVHGQAMVRNKPASDVVIWLEAHDAPRKSRKKTAVLDQRNMTFVPHVLAVEVGTVVEFPNHDRVFHNVFSIHDGKKFDLGLYPVGASRKVKFDRAGLSRIYCNIHPNMGAYVMSVDSPYFAVSDKKGNFTLKDAPAGSYVYHVWRPGGEVTAGKASLRADEPFVVQVP